MAKQATIVPRNLPLFQWINNVFDHTVPSGTIPLDILSCLERFEDVLYSHGLDFDYNYRRLAPPMMSPTQRTWYSQFKALYKDANYPPSWEMFTNAFTKRFGRAASEERANCSIQLIHIEMHAGESLDSFIDRFNDLMRRSMNECLSSAMLVDSFQRALPEHFRNQFITSKLHLKECDKENIEEVMDSAKTLYNDLFKSTTSSASAAPILLTPRGNGTSASKHATTPSAGGVAHIKNGRDSRKAAGKPYSAPTSEKYCSIHKSKTHNTAECNVFKKTQAEAAGSNTSSPSPGSARPGNANHTKKSKRDWVPKGYCYDCKQPGYNENHVCDTRATPSTAMPPRPAPHTFNMMQLPVDGDNDTQMSEHTVPTEELDVASTMAAQSCKFNEFSTFPKHMSNAILLTVVVENVATFAFLDSGASFSIVHPLFFKSLGAPLTKASGEIQLGHSSSISNRVGYTTLDIYYNKRRVSHKFEVFDFHHSTAGPFIVLGRDLMPLLNIGITGLVTS